MKTRSYYISSKKILEKLNKDHIAYYVGGFCRDYVINNYSLDNLDIYDIDISTSAKPEEILKIFKNSVYTGRKYGTVTVFVDNYKFEVTTFRLESIYEKNRRPIDVLFSKNIDDDIIRRDFTINGIYMDINMNIYDKVFAIDDIENKIIRAISNPNKRFLEDSLRILRAFSLLSKLDSFEIEKNTLKYMILNSDKLKSLSFDRINSEFIKIFNNKYFYKSIKKLYETTIYKFIPNSDKAFSYMYNNNNIEKYLDIDIFYLLIFYFDNKNINKNFFKLSNINIKKYKNVLKLYDKLENTDIKVLLYYYGYNDVCLAIKLFNCLNLDNTIEYSNLLNIYNNLNILKSSDININIKDIINIFNIEKLNIISKIIKDLEINILTNKLDNNTNSLLEYIKNKYFINH